MNFRSPSQWSIVLMLIVMTIISSNLNWGKKAWPGMLESDAKGYFAYLPAVFIYQDLNYGFFDQIEKEKYFVEERFYDYRIGAHQRDINKYYAGTALLQTPFFLLAHWASGLSGEAQDGYSKWYMIFVNIAALFYLFLGLHFLNRFLQRYKIAEWNRSMVLIACVLGTNLFTYVAVEPGMSHVFSFGLIAAFLYYSTKFFDTLNTKIIPSLALLLGLIVLTRPVNGLIILIWPFLAASLSNFIHGIRSIFQRPLILLLSVLLFILPISLQLIIYKISTGHFWVYAYGEEGFIFSDPHILDILFSYRKGLFVYTPVYLLALGGTLTLWKSNRFQFISFYGFFFILTYVLSSWWMWYYGGSFSARVYVEYLPLFMLLLAILLQNAMPKIRRAILFPLLFLLILVCQVQTYQYRYYHIHWSDMNKDKYWEVFLRIDQLMK